MQHIRDTYKNTGTLYHGYCIEGDRDGIYRKLCIFLEEDLAFRIQGNTDYWVGDFDTFGIDESRMVKEIHTNKSFRSDSRKLYVIKANFLTIEAQNALLKVFEEPGEGNHFFIITPNADLLLPTLKSRLQIIRESFSSKDLPANKAARYFIQSSPAERLAQIKELMDEISDETKTKSDAVALSIAIIQELKKKKPTENWTAKDAEIFKELLICTDYLSARSSSTKMILEHIALLI